MQKVLPPIGSYVSVNIAGILSTNAYLRKRITEQKVDGYILRLCNTAKVVAYTQRHDKVGLEFDKYIWNPKYVDGHPHESCGHNVHKRGKDGHCLYSCPEHLVVIAALIVSPGITAMITDINDDLLLLL